jgi:hypothetical protein
LDERPDGLVIPPAEETRPLSESELQERLPERYDQLRARHRRYSAARYQSGLPAKARLDVDRLYEALPVEALSLGQEARQ